MCVRCVCFLIRKWVTFWTVKDILLENFIFARSQVKETWINYQPCPPLTPSSNLPSCWQCVDLVVRVPSESAQNGCALYLLAANNSQGINHAWLMTHNNIAGTCIFINMTCNITVDQTKISQTLKYARKTTACTYQLLSTYKISLSGDIHPNPCPVKTLCRSCYEQVAKRHREPLCDACYYQYHIKCVNMSFIEYANVTDTWLCHHAHKQV